MALGAVLFIAIITLAITEHWIMAGLLLALALPYWWFADT